MKKEELNEEKLREILEAERMTKTRKNKMLTKIEPDFYSDLKKYLNETQKAFEKEYKNNPTSSKTMLLRDELSSSKRFAENILALREEKITLTALSVIKGGKPDLSLMVKEEKELYKSLLNTLKKNREKLLSVEPKIEYKKPETSSLVKHKPVPGYTVIRALDNLSFMGSDEKEYNLTVNDVASLPEDTALLLCKTGKAKEINI